MICALVGPVSAAENNTMFHDISSLSQWGPYSKEYHGIAHIDDLKSGIKVEFCIVPGQYRRNVKIPSALFDSDVHPWYVSPDMRQICYRQEIEWKDRVYADVSYNVMDGNLVMVETRCVNNTDLTQNISLQFAVRKTGGETEKWNPEISEGSDSFILKYPEVDACYGVAWTYPLSEVREFRNSQLEGLMQRKVHDHVNKVLAGDEGGHITANFFRPVTLAAHSDTTILQLIACGEREYVEKHLRYFREGRMNYAPGSVYGHIDRMSGALPEASSYTMGNRLLQATLLTNIVYPIDAFGEPIRHFCPGKNWNSLYTWDCGFIAWAMSAVDPGRGYEIIRQYTTSPEEEAPFVHHGTPLATQILAINDVWLNNACDEAMLKEIYPRLKRFYDYMSGDEFRAASGLLRTWKIFYNSGGWDDYAAQKFLTDHPDIRALTAPMVSTSYYIRCAKILRQIARHLGMKQDIRQYDRDIDAMSRGILDNAWDEECGYFGYVRHGGDGKAAGILRTSEGVNFNMGLDGCTPLVAGIASDAQNSRMLEHIFAEGELWSGCGITAVAQNAPYYRVDGYWNGTVWMPHQMLFWKTMLDFGLADRARQIAYKALDKWEGECEDSYNCYEHFMLASGRGGGWNNFSGLSSPVINWYRSYFVPGTLSSGFGTLVSGISWSEGNRGVEATLEFEPELKGRTVCLLACMAPGHRYQAILNGKPVKVQMPENGQVEVYLEASSRPSVFRLFAAD